jgi:hypothetical protein
MIIIIVTIIIIIIILENAECSRTCFEAISCTSPVDSSQCGATRDLLLTYT